MSEEVLPLYVIYKYPSDFPGYWVLREQVVARDGSITIGGPRLAETLDLVRRLLPPDLYNLGRQADDDPSIYEVWI